MSIFDKYASRINAEELAASQKEISNNSKGSGNYEDVPVGAYEVKVEKLECKTSKKGNAMISIWFRILTGNFENSMIFYNGVFYEDWMRHRVAKLMSDLLDMGDSTAAINLILKGSVAEINEFCMDMHEQIDSTSMEYLLDYGESKGYQTYTIKEVYEA